MLGLHCYESYSLVVVASLFAEHGMEGMWASAAVAHGFNSCGSWALEHRLNSCSMRALLLPSMWGLPGPGIKPTSLVLAGGFFATESLGKPFADTLILDFQNGEYSVCENLLWHVWEGNIVPSAGYYKEDTPLS